MPADPAAPRLTIARFEKALHDRSAFSCGHAAIDNFLKLSLSDQVRAGMVVAYVATAAEAPDVLGFYTLGAMAVRAELEPGKWRRAGVPDIPVIYLRAIAVRADMQGRGLGTALVVDALRRCREIADRMGAAAVVLDVLEDEWVERRRAFYARLGFRPLGDPEMPQRVFLPMADVRATLG
ncbi:MAG: GNAT family N-acetyltransferase [Amaricoccus sp.]